MSADRGTVTITFADGVTMGVHEFVEWTRAVDGSTPDGIAELAALTAVKVLRQGGDFDTATGETPELFICDGFRLGVMLAAIEPRVDGHLLERMSMAMGPDMDHEMRVWAGFIADAFELVESPR